MKELPFLDTIAQQKLPIFAMLFGGILAALLAYIAYIFNRRRKMRVD